MKGQEPFRLFAHSPPIRSSVPFMKSYGDITNGDYVRIDSQPFQVIGTTFIQMQQRRPTMELKVRNLKTGQVLTRTFKSQHDAEEIEIEKEPIQFIYANRGEYWFREPNNPAKRFSLKEEFIGESAKFLKADIEVKAIKYEGEIITVELPIKIDYAVLEAPPGIKGDTASGGTKPVVIDGVGRVTVNAPLFVNRGDVIRVNTQTGEYTERMEKAA